MAKSTQPKKKSKSAAEPEPEPYVEEDDEEEGEDVADVEEEEEEEEEAADDEDDVKRMARLRRSKINSRRSAKQKGYRHWAKDAGAGIGKGRTFANDMSKSVYSLTDTVRAAKWSSHCVDPGMDLGDFKSMLEMREEAVPKSAARVLHANMESLARGIVNEVVMRSIEMNGPMAVTAATMRSVLRPMNEALRVDSCAPLGLVRVAQHTKRTKSQVVDPDVSSKSEIVELDEFVLPKNDDDDDLIAAERAFAKQNHLKLLREADKQRNAKRVEKAEKRKAAMEAKAGAAGA